MTTPETREQVTRSLRPWTNCLWSLDRHISNSRVTFRVAAACRERSASRDVQFGEVADHRCPAGRDGETDPVGRHVRPAVTDDDARGALADVAPEQAMDVVRRHDAICFVEHHDPSPPRWVRATVQVVAVTHPWWSNLCKTATKALLASGRRKAASTPVRVSGWRACHTDSRGPGGTRARSCPSRPIRSDGLMSPWSAASHPPDER